MLTIVAMSGVMIVTVVVFPCLSIHIHTGFPWMAKNLCKLKESIPYFSAIKRHSDPLEHLRTTPQIRKFEQNEHIVGKC